MEKNGWPAWQCAACTFVNNADRPGCEMCSAGRPQLDQGAMNGVIQEDRHAENVQPPAPQAAAAIEQWLCPKCYSHNPSTSRICVSRKCGAPDAAGAGQQVTVAPTQPGIAASPTLSAVSNGIAKFAGNQMAPTVNQYQNFGKVHPPMPGAVQFLSPHVQEELRRNLQKNIQAHLPPVPTPRVTPPQQEQWLCPKCYSHNPSTSRICVSRKCGAPDAAGAGQQVTVAPTQPGIAASPTLSAVSNGIAKFAGNQMAPTVNQYQNFGKVHSPMPGAVQHLSPHVQEELRRNLQKNIQAHLPPVPPPTVTPPQQFGWECPRCKLVNVSSRPDCEACGMSLSVWRQISRVASSNQLGLSDSLLADQTTDEGLSPPEAGESPEDSLQKMKDELLALLALQGAKPPGNPLLSSLPEEWAPMSTSQGYQLVEIGSSSEEYQSLIQDFNKSMRGRNVSAIYRIQNPVLWQFYKTKKLQMKQENGGHDVDERRLYHGTDICHFHSICRENFDWRLYGTKTGAAYGQGTYFGTSAKKSERYIKGSLSSIRQVLPPQVFRDTNDDVRVQPAIISAAPIPSHPSRDRSQIKQRSSQDQVYNSISAARLDGEDGSIRALLVAKVLVGRYTEGERRMRKPPAGYDSCVDKCHNPSMFILFERTQMYPEYMIEYM